MPCIEPCVVAQVIDWFGPGISFRMVHSTHLQPQMDNAQDIIEDIQRSYFLHPVDIRSRENGPDSNETKRQLQTIRRLGGTLDLYFQVPV